MNYSKVLAQTRFKVPSDLKSLDQLLMRSEKINFSGIPKQIWLEFQLALVEGFTNAVRHAHKNLTPEVLIEIQIIVFTDKIELYVWDYGNYFDLKAFMAKLPQKKHPLALGGRGLTILHQIADVISYTRDETNRNCLFILKYYSSESA